MNLVFTFLYSIYGKLQRRYNPEPRADFTFKLRLGDLPHNYMTSNDPSLPPSHARENGLGGRSGTPAGQTVRLQLVGA